MKLFFIISFVILLASFCWLLLLGGHKDYDNDELINWGEFSKSNKKAQTNKDKQKVQTNRETTNI